MTPEYFDTVTAGIAYAPELYLFAQLCCERGVNRIVESGVCHGVSTRVFRALWPDRVTSIEYRAANVPADLPGVVLGDGRELVPAIVASFPQDQIGVFIDGPKKVAGRLLRAWCLTQPNVRVVAQHDSPIGSGEHVHSYDLEYQRVIGNERDARIAKAIRSQYVRGCPGMGVWIQ
jgi:hypothetical protein